MQGTTRSSYALFTLAFVAACAAADTSNESGRVTLSHVSGNVYVAENSFYIQENSVVYVGEDVVTVVGASWSPETARLLVDEVRKVTDKPIGEVIDTHYHLDRTGGNAYFNSIGAKIVSTEMTHQLLERHWDSMVAAQREAFPVYPDVPLVLPDTTYPGSFELQAGRVRALYLGPSHTPDGLLVYFPEEEVLFGDCILKEHLGNLDSADVVEYPKTLRKLEALDLPITTIVAGHWTPVHGPDLIDRFLEMLERDAP